MRTENELELTDEMHLAYLAEQHRSFLHDCHDFMLIGCSLATSAFVILVVLNPEILHASPVLLWVMLGVSILLLARVTPAVFRRR